MQIWGVRTPKPIDMKFDAGDYVTDITQHAKIQKDHPIGGLPACG